MKQRPIVLVFAPNFLPAVRAGGPVKSLDKIVSSLSCEFSFKVVTANRDVGLSEPLVDDRCGTWRQVGSASVRYLSEYELGLSSIRRIIRETRHDFLYLNSFFSPTFSIFPLLLRRLELIPRHPTLLAPRGEFSLGALAIKAPKKRAYLEFAKLLQIYDGVNWHASSSLEASDVRREFSIPDNRMFIASDIPVYPEEEVPARTGDGRSEFCVVFLSRISRMKNLDYALDVLTLVNVNVSFKIFGPIEDKAYWEICKSKIASLPSNVAATYCGIAKPEDVANIFRESDLFFLPTRGENFGHVIAESLSVGTPVLISNRTPWQDLSKKEMGEDFDLSRPQSFASAIDRYASLSPDDRLAVRKKVHAAIRKHWQQSNVLEENMKMFQDLARKHSSKGL